MNYTESKHLKGIYFSTQFSIKNEDIYDRLSGIGKKIKKHIEIFNENNIDIYFYNPYDDMNVKNTYISKILRRIPIKYETFKLPDIDLKNYDFIYVRKPFLSGPNILIDFLERIKKINSSIKILMEIPTYPYDNEIKSLKDQPIKWMDMYERKKFKNIVDIILTYSLDKEIWGIPTINISNGVDVNNIIDLNKKFKINNDSKIRIIACAGFTFFHGYDRAIEGIYNYINKYDNNFNSNISLEIVGNTENVPEYKQNVEKYHLQDFVNFHGPLAGEDLARIYSMCDIGLDSMGRHRSGVFYNSSLKGKEYCANGLLIVSGVKTELDYFSDYPYYFRVPANDSPLDFDKIIEFYNVSTNFGKDRMKVKDEIEQFARDNFDLRIVFKPIIDYVKRNCVKS